MRGSVSDAYGGPPICRCGHFKEVHESSGGDCDAENCYCTEFDQVALDDTELGKSMNALIESFRGAGGD